MTTNETLTFDHLALRVPDVPTALVEYRAMFPHADVLHEDPTWAMIRVGDLKLAFVLAEQHPAHVAFRTNSREEMLRLAEECGEPVKLHRDATESFYHTDTGGNTIEIIYYPNSH